MTDPPKIRIKHKSDPFVRSKPGPGPTLRAQASNKSAIHPFPRTNLKKKLLKRPVTKVKTNKRSSFQSGKGNPSFLSNPRPGARPHKIRISTATRPWAAKPRITNRALVPAETEEVTPSIVTQEYNPTTAASIIREVTVRPEVSIEDIPSTPANYFENFTDKKSAHRKSFKKNPKLDFKELKLSVKSELTNHELQPEVLQDTQSETGLGIYNQDRVSSDGSGGSLLSAQKTDLLDKLRSLTGGQVVAVTLDRVGKKSRIDTKGDHDEDGADTITEVTNKQRDRETKDTIKKAGAVIQSIFENYPPEKEQVHGPVTGCVRLLGALYRVDINILDNK